MVTWLRISLFISSGRWLLRSASAIGSNGASLQPPLLFWLMGDLEGSSSPLEAKLTLCPPFMFILVMESFNKMITEVIKENLFQGRRMVTMSRCWSIFSLLKILLSCACSNLEFRQQPNSKSKNYKPNSWVDAQTNTTREYACKIQHPSYKENIHSLKTPPLSIFLKSRCIPLLPPKQRELPLVLFCPSKFPPLTFISYQMPIKRFHRRRLHMRSTSRVVFSSTLAFPNIFMIRRLRNM